MNESILYLYQLSKSIKTKSEPIEISSSQLGDLLDVSQQSASRYLVKLERQGFIKRSRTTKGQEISLTEKGIKALEELKDNLNKFFSNEKKKQEVVGFLARGMGEGAYYIREYSAEIKKQIGFTPFPGTFNVKIPEKSYKELDLERLASSTIKGFRKEGRSFGPIKYAPVRLSVNDKQVDCYIIVPMRTHHKDVLEIISEENLRVRLVVEDNDKISVEFI